VTDNARCFAELEALYKRVDGELGSGRACRACGRCCHFDTYGHRLYATYLEALYLVAKNGPPPGPFDADTCGYQAGDACAAREGRVLGCRTFFCIDAGGENRESYERALAEIRRISDAFRVPWDYRTLAENVARIPAAADASRRPARKCSK